MRSMGSGLRGRGKRRRAGGQIDVTGPTLLGNDEVTCGHLDRLRLDHEALVRLVNLRVRALDRVQRSFRAEGLSRTQG